MTQYEHGFLMKCAEYGISVHDANELYKRAGLEKRADPPHRGIHSDNPMIRYANRNFGFVPQAPESYLSDANTEKDFLDVTADAIINMDGSSFPEDRLKQRQMWYDYMRSAGTVNNAYYNPVDDAIYMGSYPYDRRTVAAHEAGHSNDPENIEFLERLKEAKTHDEKMALYKFQSILRFLDAENQERTAWELSGVPEDDELRRAAFGTYARTHTSKQVRDAASKDPQHARWLTDDVNKRRVPIITGVYGTKFSPGSEIEDRWSRFGPESPVWDTVVSRLKENDDLPPNYPSADDYAGYTEPSSVWDVPRSMFGLSTSYDRNSPKIHAANERYHSLYDAWVKKHPMLEWYANNLPKQKTDYAGYVNLRRPQQKRRTAPSKWDRLNNIHL